MNPPLEVVPNVPPTWPGITPAGEVVARFRQDGHHLLAQDGSPGSSRPVSDVGSAVYRVEDGRIAEYWIPLDRLGLQLQLAEVATAGEPIAVSFT